MKIRKIKDEILTIRSGKKGPQTNKGNIDTKIKFKVCFFLK